MSGTIIGRQRSNAMGGAPPMLGRHRANATAKPPVVFAGHGSFNTVTDAKYPKVRLPPNITLVFWCHHGEGLLNTIGQFVESRRPLSELPDHLQQQAEGAGYRSRGIPEIVPGGSEIWNYRLTYPSGLELGSAPSSVKSSAYNRPVSPESTGRAAYSTVPGVIRDSNYCIVPSLGGDIGGRGVPIIAMLAGYWEICKDNTIHWCACRSIVVR